MKARSQEWLNLRADEMQAARLLAKNHGRQSLEHRLAAVDYGLRGLLEEAVAQAPRGASFADLESALLIEGLLDEEDIEARAGIKALDRIRRRLAGDPLPPMRPPLRSPGFNLLEDAREAFAPIDRFIEAACEPGAAPARAQRLLGIAQSRMGEVDETAHHPASFARARPWPTRPPSAPSGRWLSITAWRTAAQRTPRAPWPSVWAPRGTVRILTRPFSPASTACLTACGWPGGTKNMRRFSQASSRMRGRSSRPWGVGWRPSSRPLSPLRPTDERHDP